MSQLAVELGPRLSPAADGPAAEPLSESLQAELDEEVQRLGLPSAPTVEAGARDDIREAVRFSLDGEAIPYPAARAAEIPDLDAAAQRTAIGALLVDALRRRPSCLLDPSGVDAADHARLCDLLDLGVTLPEALGALAAVREAAAEWAPEYELVEIAFALVGRPSAEIAAHPESLEAVAGDPDWDEDVRATESQVFETYGVRLPPLDLVPAPELDPGVFDVSVCRTFSQRVRAEEAEVVLSSLQALVGECAGRLVSLPDVERLLAALELGFPAIVRSLSASVPAAGLVRVLRLLLAEGISVGDLRTIADRLLEYEIGPAPGTPEACADWVRRGFRDRFAYVFAPEGRVHAVIVHPDLEARVEELGVLPRDERQGVRDEIAAEVGETPPPGVVVLTSASARRPLRDALAPEFPSLPVLARDELPLSVDVVRVAGIGA